MVSRTTLDPDEVAQRLGVSRKTVQRLMQSHRIGYVVVADGRKRMITEQQLAEYIDSQTVPAQPDLATG